MQRFFANFQQSTCMKRSFFFELAISAALVSPIFLLIIIYPALPSTFMGWFATVASSWVICAWGMVSAVLIKWSEGQQRFRPAYRTLAVLVAITLACGIFWIAFSEEPFFAANFSYFGH